MPPELISLASLCHNWGGKLKLVAADQFNKIFPKPGEDVLMKWGVGLYHAPFADNLGVNWKQKIVYGSESENEWPGIVHEMGHVFACRKNPNRSDDFEFFGWEYAVIKFIKANEAQWIYHNRDYAVNTRSSERSELFGSLSPLHREGLCKERMNVARQAGILNAKFEPLAIR